MINHIYHEEDPEYYEELKRKQEITKKYLHAVLTNPKTIEKWKYFHKIEIKPELVNVIQIDLENSFEKEDELLFEKYIVEEKRILFVAKLNENEPIQIEYTSEDWGKYLLELIVPADYHIDFSKHISEEKEEH